MHYDNSTDKSLNITKSKIIKWFLAWLQTSHTTYYEIVHSNIWIQGHILNTILTPSEYMAKKSQVQSFSLKES